MPFVILLAVVLILFLIVNAIPNLDAQQKSLANTIIAIGALIALLYALAGHRLAL